MNKTIYVRDEDAATWDRAREFAGDKLAPVIVDSLRKYVKDCEAEVERQKGFERLIVKFNAADDHFIPKIKAFNGKWVIPPDKRLKTTSEEQNVVWRYAVAVTPKGGAVITWVEEDGDGMAEHFKVYSSLEVAAADLKVNYPARKAIEQLGIPVEELDI